MPVNCCGVEYDKPGEFFRHSGAIYKDIQYEMFHAAMQRIAKLLADGDIDRKHANKLMSRLNNFTLNELQEKF